MDHPILVVQERQQRVLRVQQHLPLPLLLSLPRTVRSLLQRQDLMETHTHTNVEMAFELLGKLMLFNKMPVAQNDKKQISRTTFAANVWCSQTNAKDGLF